MQRGQGDVQSWPQDLDQDQLVTGSDVDFTKFLELGNDFSQFEAIEQQNVPSGLDTPMGRLTFGQNGQVLSPQQQALLQDMAMSMGGIPQHMDFQQMQQSPGQAAQYQQYPIYQQMQNPYQHQVPPTPVSAEMHAAKYAQTIDASGQIMFERQNASFTPLVSPAQTPLDHTWSMPDYVVGEEFFSPLTSPAIEAQQHMTATNATSSPVDLNLDNTSAGSKRPRRKLNPTSRVSSVRNLKAPVPSKINTRRRQNSLSNGSLDSPVSSLPKHKHLLPDIRHAVSTGSEDSVSPEPFVESAMRPPPVPHPKTPNILHPQSRTQNAPATPATLMQIPGNQLDNIGDRSAVQSPENMEDISLGAAAADIPSRILPEINTNINRDDEDGTPTLSAKTPKLSADSTPRSTGMRFSNNSQELLSKPSRGGRQAKKRQSISQATVSPALRPKISPSISPMVPSTASGIPIMSAETSALYLASKSNYQNIIDGTHLPGVSYPETLAENLSSKRTSHKIAEQGRRNRINLALKEIESLLPASITAAAGKREKENKDDGADSGDKPSSGQGASKASTVEMAIVYIRSLQEELLITKAKLEAAETKLTEGNSSSSQASDQT